MTPKPFLVECHERKAGLTRPPRGCLEPREDVGDAVEGLQGAMRVECVADA